jgi:hypothetical protein
MQEIPTVQQPTQVPQQPMYQQQPPMYPPPTYQPPQKPPHSRKRLWLIIGIIASVLVLGIIGASMAASGGQQTTTPQATQVVQQATTQPSQPTATQAPQANTIGKPVQVGDTWVVTVNSVKTSKGTEFITPKSGDTFLVIDVTLKNISASVQHASGLMQWSLRDDSGQRMQVSLLMGSDPGGTVTAGNLVRGQLSYEIPIDQHHFVLQFVPDFSGDVAEWDVNV